MNGNGSLPEILYIMGFGRSGTTILEILLASSPGTFGAGELTHIYRDGFLADVACSCGAPTSHCPVWSRVRERVGGSVAEDRNTLRILRKIEAHARFPLLLARLNGQEILESYRSTNARLFTAIAEATGSATVIDSSKYAGRALALSRAFPERVRVLSMTRSPAGLMSSFRKPRCDEQRQKPIVHAVMYHAYVLACLRAVERRLGSRVFGVRYEELVTNPVGTLRRLEGWWGHDLTDAIARLERDETFHIGHIVTGNRIRYRGEVRLDSAAGEPRLGGQASRLAVRLMELYEQALVPHA